MEEIGLLELGLSQKVWDNCGYIVDAMMYTAMLFLYYYYSHALFLSRRLK